MAVDNTKIIKGDDLMGFIDGKSLAFATSHTLTLGTETFDVASKDHGAFSAVIPSVLTWEVSTENLYSVNGFKTLQDAWLQKKKVQIVFGHSTDGTHNEDAHELQAENWTPYVTEGYLKGDAYITALSVNANHNENATFSATFSGCGPLTYSTDALQ